MQFINKKQYGKKQAGEWLAFFVSAKLALLIIKGRIECIEVLTVQVILHNPYTFTETLEVYNFSCTQEFNRIINIWVILQGEEYCRK